MLTNAKVGTKLLILIVAPVMVLLAVASLGARDRLDEATDAEQVESAAQLTGLTDAVVRSLGTERLITAASLAGGSAEGLDEARAETDATLARVRPALAATGLPDGFTDRLRQADRRLADIDDLRQDVDGADVDVQDALDSYDLAIDELIRLEDEVATATSAAELSLALGNANVLSQAEEARSQLAAAGAVAVGAEAFAAGDLEQLTDLREEQDRLLARFTDGATPASAAALRDALATPEVVAADIQLEGLISDATIGGSGAPEVGLDQWILRQSGWLDTVGATDRELVEGVSAAASDAEFAATKAARLFMIATAAATLLSILLAIWVARSIDRPLRRLTTAANELASDRLPDLVENLRSPHVDAEEHEAIEPIEVTSSDEIGQVTEAFNAIQQVTLNVAEEQSTLLRKGIGDIFVNLARRNQSLLDRQIEFIDELESKEQDPDLLENLFRLDHLATRMRRNAESLLVLAGAEPARRRAKPVALADVVRVAIGEVEDFTRVELHDLDHAIVAGNLAVDLSHLLSELMENATHFSPPETPVEIAGQFGGGGSYVLTVADHGIGMSGEDLTEANLLLANPPLVGLALGRSLGFIVVGRIAVRLGLQVHLNASPAGGVTAMISLPADLVAGPDDPEPRDPLLVRSRDDAAPSGAPEALPTRPVLDRGLESPPPVGPSPAPPEPDPEPSADAATAPPPPLPLPVPVPVPVPPGDSPVAPTGQLSEALPEGDAFEEGLASLIGPESSDIDVAHQFWGSLADEDESPDAEPVPTEQPDAEPVPTEQPEAEPTPVEPTPVEPVKAEQPDAEPTAVEPTPVEPTAAEPTAAEQPDAEPAAVEPAAVEPTAVEPTRAEPAGVSGLPAPSPDAADAADLIRRVPGAASAPSLTIGPAVDSPRRSPEQVRAMLSRYREGLKGRRAPGAPDENGSTTEDFDE